MHPKKSGTVFFELYTDINIIYITELKNIFSMNETDIAELDGIEGGPPFL